MGLDTYAIGSLVVVFVAEARMGARIRRPYSSLTFWLQFERKRNTRY